MAIPSFEPGTVYLLSPLYTQKNCTRRFKDSGEDAGKREVSSRGELTRCCITDSVELNFAEPGRMSVKRRLMMVKLRVKGTRAGPWGRGYWGRGRKDHAPSQPRTRCAARGLWHTTPACSGDPIILEIQGRRCPRLGLFVSTIHLRLEMEWGGEGRQQYILFYVFPILATCRNPRWWCQGSHKQAQEGSCILASQFLTSSQQAGIY